MASPIVSGFSLTHAEILDGTKDFLSSALMRANADARDIYGVSEAGIDLDMDDYTNEGDDVELEKWFWGKSAEVEVQAGYISFPLIGSLTGRSISSSGTSAGAISAIVAPTGTSEPTSATTRRRTPSSLDSSEPAILSVSTSASSSPSATAWPSAATHSVILPVVMDRPHLGMATFRIASFMRTAPS